MSGTRYTEEFKIAAVKQVLDKGHSFAEVASRLGTTTHSIYAWIKRYGQTPAKRAEAELHVQELRRLKTELKRVTEERDILKKAAAYFAKNSE